MMRLTEAQRLVVETPGHLLVDAGAGSGKTTTVVQALCHQLGLPVRANGGEIAPSPMPLTFEEIAAITFTNQAAADLKRKLRAALRAARHPLLAAEVDSARIGTIHGFCGDLLRDFALRAGTRPGRRTITDGEAAVLLADHAREAIHAALENGDVDGLEELLAGRRLKDIVAWTIRAAGDSDRLERWRAGAGELRAHERALLVLAERASAAHTDALVKAGELDFDLMIVATRDLLRDEGVRHAVQRRIRLLVVDEFQDVDPVQRDIAELLGGLANASDPTPSRLILVGDPKQSIYRFRRADVTVWNGIAERFGAGAGTVLPLVENFRSKAAILGFVDTVIGPLLDAPVDSAADRKPFEVQYAPLIACAPDHAGDRAVELLVVPPDDEGKARNATEVREFDAAGIASRVVALHAEGRPWRDFAVLLASWKEADRIEAALRDAGVPAYVQRGEGFWEAREVLDCVLALRALRDPTDQVAVVGFLKSPFVGLRDDTLLALARAEGTFVAALAAVPAERPLLDRARRLFERFTPLRDRLPAHELLRRLLFESGYGAAVALLRDGPQRVANLRKLLRVAGAAPDLSLGEFLREIEEARDREDKVALERLYGDGGDVVTITSVHGAKGLEWPVVIWADLVREMTGEKEKLVIGRDSFSLQAGLEPGEDAKAKDARHEDAKRHADLEGRAESYRTWYVAATRAKELLILSGLPAGDDTRKTPSPARIFRGSLGDPGQLKEFAYESRQGVIYAAPVRAIAGPGGLGAERAESAPDLTLPPARRRAPSGAARLSASQLMTFAHEAEQWRRLYVARFDGAGANGLSRTATRAVVTGQIVHDVLERIANAELEFEALLEDAIGRWDEDAPDAGSDAGRAYRAFVRERIAAATASPAWQALAAAPGARRELAFTRVLADGTVINGAFDLAAPLDGGVRLLDVKTGAVGSGDELAERYRVQAAVYCDAARAITGAASCDFALLSLPGGSVIEVALDVDVAALIARLRAFDGGE